MSQCLFMLFLYYQTSLIFNQSVLVLFAVPNIWLKILGMFILLISTLGWLLMELCWNIVLVAEVLCSLIPLSGYLLDSPI